jgi:uncharacterized membrane protein YjgN (DUF898 family)
LGVYYFFWAPKMFACVRGHLSVGGCRFHGEVEPGELFKLAITNLLLLVLTLGLGIPWVLARTLRFFVSRLALENPSRLDAANQAGRPKVAAGEAMGDA